MAWRNKYSITTLIGIIWDGEPSRYAERSHYGAFSTLRPFGLLYSYPQQVPALISRGAKHHTDSRDLYQRRRELLPMNFASKSVIHENPLGSFTCRKAGIWDILFYFPSEERHTEDFPEARKIQRLRLGLNPRTRVPVASMLTTKPPKPQEMYQTSLMIGHWTCYVLWKFLVRFSTQEAWRIQESCAIESLLASAELVICNMPPSAISMYFDSILCWQ